MSDRHLRELERRFAETKSIEDEAAWLQERVRAGVSSGGLRPVVRIDQEERLARFKVTYVSPCDSKRCPATRSLELLRRALRSYQPGDLTSITTEGDRTLFFEVMVPQFDLGPYRARVSVFCAAGAVYSRATRRLAVDAPSGVVFVPSSQEDCLSRTLESAEHLVEDLEDQGLGAELVPIMLQHLPWGTGIELQPRQIESQLTLPFLGVFRTSRKDGKGIQNALFDVLWRARRAYLLQNGAREL